MPIYINRNGQQSGPYEDHIVIDQLRSGVLSPDDMGIRHGDPGWQPLGSMFPGVARSTAPPPPVASAPTPQVANLSATPAKAAGGCRKPLGWTTLAFGIIFAIAGIGLAVGTEFTYSLISCDLAESDQKKVDELYAKYQKVKGTSEEFGVKYELDAAMAGAETSSRYCGEARSTKRMFQIGAVAVAVLGFLMVIVGFFIRRV